MPFNDAAKNEAVDAMAVTHVGIHTDTDPGTGPNANAGEATGGSPLYARQPVAFGAAATGQRKNTAAETWDVPAGTYAFFTLYNALTGNTNNYRGYIPFGGASAIKGFFAVDTTLANDQFLSPAHGLSDNDRVLLFDTFGDALPTGVSEGTLYHVVASTADTFKVALTQGGAAVDLTGVGGGEGFFQRCVPETFASQGQITAAIDALVLDGTVI